MVRMVSSVDKNSKLNKHVHHGFSGSADGYAVEPNAFNPPFLGHFSPVLRRLFAVLSRFPASWRQDGENGRKMA